MHAVLLQNEHSTLSPPPGFSTGKTIENTLIQEVLELIQNEDTYKWTDKEGNITRKTINFGWDYVAMEFGKYIFNPIPLCIQHMREMIVQSLSLNLEPHLLPESFDNIIVTIYEQNQHLMPHYDADDIPNPITKRNFSFAEPIIGCVLKADTESSFTFYHHFGNDRPSMDMNYIYKTPEVDGSTFLIDKECRHFPYFHAIPPVKNKRISITMRRTVLPKDIALN